MPETVIRVENLGKKYLIQKGPKERYTALRDVIARKVSSVGSHLINFIKKHKTKNRFEEFWALKDLNIEIKSGEIVGIIGRNGAGKSTLLKILSRITEPSIGRFSLNGRVASLLEVGTGFHPELTGRENIFLNGAILGMSHKEITNKFQEIVDFAEIGKFLDTPVKRYSSGMYVRLAFSVAAHLEPEILLIDEVLAVGDAAFQKKCLGKMGNVAIKGRTVLFVSHNMGMIQNLCNRAIFLSSGMVIADGTPKNIISKYMTSFSCNHQSKYIAQSDFNIPMQVLEVYCKNQDGVLNNTFDISDEIIFSIKYTVRKNLSGAAIELRILKDDTTLFTAFDTDDDDKLLEIRSPGTYTVNCSVPPHILKSGRYYVHIGTGILNRHKLYFVENAISFDVNSNSIGDSFKSFSDRREGLLVSPVAWKFVDLL